MVKEGSAYGIVIEAAHVPPNNHNAYAAWLYNSPTDAYRIGFVSPAVGKSGQLQVGSALPANAGHFKQLLLTVETQSNPKSPGRIVLQGPFSLTASSPPPPTRRLRLGVRRGHQGAPRIRSSPSSASSSRLAVAERMASAPVFE